MPDDFTRFVVCPPRPRCIGVKLNAYSLGHRLFLKHIDSAFVAGRFPTYEDLISAALICSNSWEENLSLFNFPLRLWIRLKIWGLLAGKFNVAMATIIFQDYVMQSDFFPEIEQPPANACREISSPFEARLYLFLRRSGINESEAMNMPIGMANALFVTDAEDRDRLKLIADRTRDLIRAAKEMA